MSALKRSRIDMSRSVAPKKKAWKMVMKPGVGILGSLTNSRYSSRVPELKFVDTAVLSKTIGLDTAPPVATNLFQTVQGAFGYQRIGQRVQLKSIRIRGHIQSIVTQANSTIGRIIIVYDRQANGASPLWTDVIGAVTAAGAASSTIRDGMNLSNRERFIMLADEQLFLPSNTDTAGSIASVEILTANDKNPSMFNVDRYIKLRDLETHFNNTNGGTVADIQTGSLSLFFATDSVGNNGWQLTFTTRTRYQDL